MNKKVAIIIPVFNEEDLIYYSLLKLTEQTVNPDLFEIIIVDNNCTDKTMDKVGSFIEIYPRLVVKVIKEKRQGIKFARKSGFDFGSRYSYLATIDADTLVGKKFIEEIISTFEKRAADGIVWRLRLPWETMIEFSLKTRREIGKFIRKRAKIQKFIEKYFGSTLLGPCYAVTSRIYKKTGRLDFGGGPLRYEDDIIFSRRIIYDGGKIITSHNWVTISDRRMRDNLETYLTGESYWGEEELKFRRKINKKLKSVSPSVVKKLWDKRIEISASIFLRYFLDALLYYQKIPNCKVATRIVTHVVNDVLQMKEGILPNIESKTTNWPDILKELERRFLKQIEQKLSNYVKEY